MMADAALLTAPPERICTSTNKLRTILHWYIVQTSMYWYIAEHMPIDRHIMHHAKTDIDEAKHFTIS